MSSRLLTMKFMQRASASRNPSSPSNAPDSASATPDASSNTAPATPSHPPAKKQRLSNGASAPSYTPQQHRQTEQERIVAEAVAAEERKREEALDRLGREKGESKWVLSTAPAVGGGEDEGEGRFVTVGLGQIDAEDAGWEECRGLGSRGRRTFGRVVKRKGDVEGEVGSEDSEEEGDSESESEDEGPMDVDGLIHRGRSEAAERARRELKEKRREEGRKSSTMASERRGRGMNLNSLRGGISSGGGSSGRGGGNQRGKRKSY
ncbi:hypothetical protein B9Z65_1950 [Elsinoe australis]|uniref:Uncharacterized protein n=1 Tax=Elsinoe australis TaxID=40998 RepID=A0A2P7YLB9_9PEZI|nr:hypothetical protein B9Z65_1950 [Elsinoe australis]